MSTNKKVFAKVVPLTPKFLLLKEVYKYTGMEESLFRKAAKEYGLRTYARGPKKVWHKVSDIDEMMESFLLIDIKKSHAANMKK